jgi:hypothetical protein
MYTTKPHTGCLVSISKVSTAHGQPNRYHSKLQKGEEQGQDAANPVRIVVSV